MAEIRRIEARLYGSNGHNGLSGRITRLEEQVAQLSHGWYRTISVILSVITSVVTALVSQWILRQ